MRVFLKLILLISFGLNAKVDTLDLLSYLPLQIGNKWQYQDMDNSQLTTVEIIDTVTMDNGKTYFEFDQGLYHHTPFPIGTLIRIDTTSLTVKCYGEMYDQPDGEYPVAYFTTGDTTDSSFIVVHQLLDSTYSVPGTDSTFPGISVHGGGWNFVMSKGLGITYQESFLHSWLPIRYNLVAAQIDSVLYGQFLSIDEIQVHQPENYLLYQNYPNPFNPITTIEYDLHQRSEVQLIIYDITGRRVAQLISETQSAGQKSIQWDATNHPSGVYFCRLMVGDQVKTRKMLVLK